MIAIGTSNNPVLLLLPWTKMQYEKSVQKAPVGDALNGA